MPKYAYTSLFAQFPVELVDEISRYSDTKELLTLCLVSKQTGNVATRLLYHSIVVVNLRSALGCFKTLAEKKDVASCVKRFGIEIPTHNLLRSFNKLAAEAFRNTNNLVALDISNINILVEILVDIQFPRLHEVKIPHVPLLYEFLKQHKDTLKAIVIQPPSTPAVSALGLSRSYPNHSRYLTSVELPELLAYVGPCTAIPYIVPGSKVRYLTVCWEPGCEKPEEIVKFIKLSNKEVVAMDNLVLGWNPTLLEVIGLDLPKMEKLRIRNVCSYATIATIQGYLLFLEEGLKSFTCLHTLAVTLMYNPHKYVLGDLDEEFSIVQRWGKLIPSLVFLTLPSTTRWCRHKDDLWFPIVNATEDLNRHVKLRWFFKAFLEKKYPQDMMGPRLAEELQQWSVGPEGVIEEDDLPAFLFSDDDDDDETEEDGDGDDSNEEEDTGLEYSLADDEAGEFDV